MVVRTHMDYIFPTENENVLLSQRWTHFILPSKFRISIHNVADCPILDKYENDPNQFVYLLFLQKGAASAPECLIYFEYNNYIQERNPVLE